MEIVGCEVEEAGSLLSFILLAVHDHITRISCVDDFDTYSKPGYLYVYTRNSVYYFREEDEE